MYFWDFLSVYNSLFVQIYTPALIVDQAGKGRQMCQFVNLKLYRINISSSSNSLIF
jgi:hypothetical protein